VRASVHDHHRGTDVLDVIRQLVKIISNRDDLATEVAECCGRRIWL
jgi:hypothetical protein